MRLRLVERGERGTRLVFVAGIAAEREQRIRRKGHELGHGDPAGDVLNVGVQSPVLMDDQHAGELACRLGRLNQETPHLARTQGRLILRISRLNTRIVLRHLLGERVVRAQHLQQSRPRQATDRETRCPLHKPAPVDAPMREVVIQIQQILVEVSGGFPFHTAHARD